MSAPPKTGRLRAAFFASALAATAAHANEAAFYGAQPDGPRALLLQRVAGESALSPAIALYGDGKVIFRARGGDAGASGYRSTRLDATQYERLLSSIAGSALDKLGESYVSSSADAAQVRVLHIWKEGRRQTVSVFGGVDGDAAASLPPELRRVLATLEGFRRPASAWVPESFELYLWARLRPAAESLPWPAKLPPSDRSVPMNDPMQAFALDGSNFAAVQRIVARLQPGQAVRFGGRHWTVGYRLRLPYEQAWTPRRGQEETQPVPGPAPSVALQAFGRAAYGSPMFVLYTDGLVIYDAGDEAASPSGYLSARLSEKRHRELVSAIAPEALLRLRDRYDAITGTDPVAYVMHVWTDGRRKSVSVSGHLFRRPEPGDSRPKTPPEFLRAFDAMLNFSVPAGPWLPEAIEVELWPRQTFAERARRWPLDWPSLDDASLGRTGLRRIRLPGSELPRLKKLAAGDSIVTLVAEGQRWGLSHRLTFPREETWMH